jgi:hypothetical protein
MEVDVLFSPLPDPPAACFPDDPDDELLAHPATSATRAVAPAAPTPNLPIPNVDICYLTSGREHRNECLFPSIDTHLTRQRFIRWQKLQNHRLRVGRGLLVVMLGAHVDSAISLTSPFVTAASFEPSHRPVRDPRRQDLARSAPDPLDHPRGRAVLDRTRHRQRRHRDQRMSAGTPEPV